MRAEIDPYVQEMVAGTNGNMYRKVIGKLKSYPIPDFPISAGGRRLLLEIGCGWGRWMVSAGQAGFIPIGIDIKLDAALAAKRVLESHTVKGFCVVADMESLPFVTDSFDMVWSYSVVQHVHRTKARECIREVYRVLKPGTRCLIEFPIAHGIGNRLRTRPNAKEENDPDSWCVRYYSIKGLAELLAFDPSCNLLRSGLAGITYPVISEVPVLTRAAAQKV